MLSDKNIVVGQTHVRERLSVMVNIEGSSNYLDTIDSTIWNLVEYESEMLNIRLISLVRLPLKPVDYLIELILNSNDMEVVDCLCLMLVDRNFDDDNNQRLFFVEKLEEYYNECGKTEFDLEKIKLCIYESALFDPTNVEPIMNKTQKQIRIDNDFCLMISKRAKELLARVKI